MFDIKRRVKTVSGWLNRKLFFPYLLSLLFPAVISFSVFSTLLLLLPLSYPHTHLYHLSLMVCKYRFHSARSSQALVTQPMSTPVNSIAPVNLTGKQWYVYKKKTATIFL